MNKLQLERLIALIDHDLAQVDADRPAHGAMSHEDWKKHDAGIAAAIARLEKNEGARFKDGSEAQLKMAGVSTTCTGGRHGLLRNWQNAARRKIDQHAERGAA